MIVSGQQQATLEPECYLRFCKRLRLERPLMVLANAKNCLRASFKEWDNRKGATAELATATTRVSTGTSIGASATGGCGGGSEGVVVLVVVVVVKITFP